MGNGTYHELTAISSKQRTYWKDGTDCQKLLKKSKTPDEDPYIAILTYRTTPVDMRQPSPATLLINRKSRTQLPCSGYISLKQVTVISKSFIVASFNRNDNTTARHLLNYLLSYPDIQSLYKYLRLYRGLLPSCPHLRWNRVTTQQNSSAAAAATPPKGIIPTPTSPTLATPKTDKSQTNTLKSMITTNSGRVVRPPTRINMWNDIKA